MAEKPFILYKNVGKKCFFMSEIHVHKKDYGCVAFVFYPYEIF